MGHKPIPSTILRKYMRHNRVDSLCKLLLLRMTENTDKKTVLLQVNAQNRFLVSLRGLEPNQVFSLHTQQKPGEQEVYQQGQGVYDGRNKGACHNRRVQSQSLGCHGQHCAHQLCRHHRG